MADVNIDIVRLPFGKKNGALRHMRPDSGNAIRRMSIGREILYGRA